MAPPAPARAYILCLTGLADLATLASEVVRVRFAGSHIVELLQEPGDVTAVVSTLQHSTCRDGHEVEVIVAEAAKEATAEAALLRAHWPIARWVLLGGPASSPVSATPGRRPLGTGEALVREVWAAVEEYRRRRQADVKAALARMELLQSLPPARLTWLAERVQPRRYEAGEVIVRAGEPGDGVYFIRSGEIRVLDAEAGGRERVIVRRGRGEHFGELALITGEPRSNTVVAELDSEIFFLPKEHYDALMGAEPALSYHLSRVLGARLARAQRRHRATPRIIACCRVLPDDAEGTTTRALAAAIAAETERPAVLLELEALAPLASGDALERIIRRLDDPVPLSKDDCVELGPGLWRVAARRPETLRHLGRPQVVPALLDVLTQTFQFVVVGLGIRTPPDVLVRIVKQCDVLLLHAGRGADHLRQAGTLLARVRQECPSAAAKILIAAEPQPRGAAAEDEVAKFLGSAVHHRLPRDTTDALAVRTYRLVARRLVGIAVGLALGGGGARGAAHLGVLEVLTEAGIPIDMIGATSAGAIVGGGIARGWSVAEAVEYWRRETVVSPIRRYTLSKAALFSDRGLESMLRRLYGTLRVEELPIPFFAVATDLQRAVATPIDRGPLWLAVRASCSLPGAVAPVRIGDTYFVDGGVANNVPADLLRSRGARFVIAVDISRERGFNDPRWGSVGAARGLRRIPWLREFLDAPSMLQVLTRAMEVQSVQTVRARAWSWNVCIRPDVAKFGSLEFGATDTLMARGREAAARSLPDIKAGLRSLLDEL